MTRPTVFNLRGPTYAARPARPDLRGPTYSPLLAAAGEEVGS